ncbi:MAG TPA: glycosyltransferase 87 family protein [Gemmatimonadales bacterium]|nr:glycosyltransferase 87 family protein [Gemmatimonadales bacterium]
MQLPAARTMPARAARLLVLAVLIGIGISHVVFAIRDWPLGDMDVYLAAARRLRDGEPLYVAGDVAVNSFWYAPWYAVLWVPLTYLPREMVAVGWSAILLVATAAVALILARQGRWGVMVALLVGPPLFAVSAGGNVQPLMVLALLLGFHRSWGPIAVAVAASMKFTPVLLVAAYVARREWWKALASLVAAGVLLVPGYLMGITNAGVQSGAAPSLLGVSPVVYGTVVAMMIGVTFLVQRRYALLAATAAAVLALPRLFVYDVTLIASAAAPHPTPGERP